ncbi:universal stress protein [Latilactobacillus curvatus]|uniref:universal stress protein n=1 Tax=Latilactobacillus curvatus TaxID=28038 RepID=UPI002408911E|nr:universal stress protein [Latilactobacillus curvatus]
MITTYKKILVGVDGSDLANKAFMEAVEVAKRNDAELYVAHIIPSTVYVSPDAEDDGDGKRSCEGATSG